MVGTIYIYLYNIDNCPTKRESNSQTLVMTGTNCIDRCKSNYRLTQLQLNFYSVILVMGVIFLFHCKFLVCQENFTI